MSELESMRDELRRMRKKLKEILVLHPTKKADVEALKKRIMVASMKVGKKMKERSK